MFLSLAGGCRSRVTVLLRKKFPSPKDAERAMVPKEMCKASGDVLSEGIDPLTISYVRIYDAIGADLHIIKSLGGYR